MTSDIRSEDLEKAVAERVITSSQLEAIRNGVRFTSGPRTVSLPPFLLR